MKRVSSFQLTQLTPTEEYNQTSGNSNSDDDDDVCFNSKFKF